MEEDQSKLRKILPLAIVLFVVSLATGSYELYSYTHPYNYKYSKLVEVKLSNENGGHTGVSVLRPAEFSMQPSGLPANAKILQKPLQARLIHQKQVRGKAITIGQMAINSVFVPVAPKDKNYVGNADTQLINRLMTDDVASGHSGVTAPAQNYVINLLNPNFGKPTYSLSFGSPKSLKGFNRAWLTEFKAAAKNSKNTPDMQGEVVEIYGKNAHYFMALDTAKVNWQSNQSIWQQVINSLKIDQ